MERFRIDHQLRRNAERPQRLVHLLAAEDGHVEIIRPPDEQRGRADPVRVEEGERDLQPDLQVPPRRPQLVLVLHRVLVAAVHRDLVGAPGPADSRLEAAVPGDRRVGQNAAVAPAADPEPVRIGHAEPHGLLHAGEQIVHFLVAPVGENAPVKADPKPLLPR